MAMSEASQEPKGADWPLWTAPDVGTIQESKGTDWQFQRTMPLHPSRLDAPLRIGRRDGGHTMRIRTIHIPQLPRIGLTNM